MAFCTRCGKQIEEGRICDCSSNAARKPDISATLNAWKDKATGAYSKFTAGSTDRRCPNCGMPLIDGVCPHCSAETAQQTGQQANNPDNKFKAFFMNPKEKIVSVLGNDYLQNFLTGGGISKAFSVVSDKRVYFRGTMYETTGGRLRKIKNTSAINIRDVTGVGVTYISPIRFIVMGCLFTLLGFLFLASPLPLPWFVNLPCFPIGIGNFILFVFRRKTLLDIRFAGGALCFDVKWFSERESLDYQKALFLAKDKIWNDAE